MSLHTSREATDHFTQSEVDDVNIALKNAEQMTQSSSLGVSSNRGIFGSGRPGSSSGSDFISLISKVPGMGDGFASQARDLKAASAAQEQENARSNNNLVPGMSPNFDPVKVAKQIYPILEFRDRIVRAISNTISKIPGLESLLDKISETLTAFILGLLAPFVRPIINQVSKVLKNGSSEIISSSAKSQFEPWSNPRCDNPTHSMLSKDHFTNVLNSCAGRVAATILQYVVPYAHLLIVNISRLSTDSSHAAASSTPGKIPVFQSMKSSMMSSVRSTIPLSVTTASRSSARCLRQSASGPKKPVIATSSTSFSPQSPSRPAITIFCPPAPPEVELSEAVVTAIVGMADLRALYGPRSRRATCPPPPGPPRRVDTARARRSRTTATSRRRALTARAAAHHFLRLSTRLRGTDIIPKGIRSSSHMRSPSSRRRRVREDTGRRAGTRHSLAVLLRRRDTAGRAMPLLGSLGTNMVEVRRSIRLSKVMDRDITSRLVGAGSIREGIDDRTERICELRYDG